MSARQILRIGLLDAIPRKRNLEGEKTDPQKIVAMFESIDAPFDYTVYQATEGDLPSSLSRRDCLDLRRYSRHSHCLRRRSHLSDPGLLPPQEEQAPYTPKSLDPLIRSKVPRWVHLRPVLHIAYGLARIHRWKCRTERHPHLAMEYLPLRPWNHRNRRRDCCRSQQRVWLGPCT